MSRLGEAEVPLRRALRVAPKHERAIRKLRQLRAEQLKPRQAAFEAEQKMTALAGYVDKCGDNGDCLQAVSAEGDVTREADGPLVI